MDFDVCRDPELLQSQGKNSPDSIALVGRHTRVIAADPERVHLGQLGRNRNQIMHFQRLINGRKRVKAVRSRGAKEKPEVDLRVRSDYGRHTGSL
jgi:hypothetical protein